MTHRLSILIICLTSLCADTWSQTTGKSLQGLSIRPDTIPGLLQKLPLRLSSTLFSTITAQKDKTAGLLNFRKQLDLATSTFKNPIVFNQGKAAYNFTDNSSYAVPDQQAYLNGLMISSSWTIASIPFEISFDHQTWNDLAHNNFSNVSVHFDRENYLNQLKKKLKGNLDPGNLMEHMNNPVEGLRRQAEELLRKDLEVLNKDFGNLLDNRISEVGDLKTLFTKDMVAVRQQVLNNDLLKNISDKEQLITELQHKKNTGQPVDAAMFTQLEKEITSLKGATAVVAKIEEHKKKWENSGLLNKMKQLDLLNKKKLEAIAKDPANTIKQVKQQLNLSGIQRFFLKMSDLNIGQNTLSESPLSVNHLLNNGINTSFFNNNRLLMLGMGKMRSLNSILDMPFTDNLNALDGMAKTLKLGTGNSASSHTHMSVMTYNQSFGSFDGFSPLNSFRNSLITTISHQLNIGAKGILKGEVSRSATTYQQTGVSDSTLPDKSAMQRIFSGDDLFRNMAFSVSYEDELEESGIAYGLHINKTANGYVNPGSAFLNAGGTELGVNFRKSFWKRKLQTSIRTEVRDFNYSEQGDMRYRNMYTVMDLRLRLKQGQSVAIRYIPNRMTRRVDGKKSTVSLTDRLSLEGTLAKRIAGNFYRNTFTLSWQRNKYASGNELIGSTALTASSFQNYSISGKLVYLNTNYTYANNRSQYVYFNSSFLGEAGVTLLLFKKISASSALTYNSVSGWYQQAGIRQTISNQLNNRFTMNLFIDARKNLKVYEPLLYGLFRADLSIQYSINK